MRNIVVQGEAFTWKVGRTHVSIRRVRDRKGWHPGAHEVVGVTPDVFERGRWKKTSDCSVTPGQVADWIKQNVMEKA